MKRMVDKKEYVSPEDKFKGSAGGKEVNLFSGYVYIEYNGKTYNCASIVQALSTPNITEQVEIANRSDIIQAAQTMWANSPRSTAELYYGFGIDDDNAFHLVKILLTVPTGKVNIYIDDVLIGTDLDIDDDKLTTFSIELDDLSNGNSIFHEE